jgi:hypothetical protein
MNPMTSFRTYALAFLLCLEPSPLQARLGQSIRGSGSGMSKTQQRVLKELEGFGGTPDAQYLPLQECQGDCDEDTGN